VTSARGSLHPQVELAQRLRALREERWPDLSLTQAQIGQVLAEGLGDRKPFSVAAISSWESTRAPRTPRPDHLRVYARFFATRRSVEGDRLRLLAEAELTDEERAAQDELQRELLGLREAAVQGAADVADSPPDPPEAAPPSRPLGDFWRFGEKEDVTIISSELPQSLKERMPLADRSSPDYIAAYDYADLDALIELHGHLRAVNPHNQVNIRLARELREDDYTSHLILLGGLDWNQATKDVLALLDLQISLKRPDDLKEEAYFEVHEDERSGRYPPSVTRTRDRIILQADVAHFYRGLNPFNAERTVTICQALFGRGTLGVVRALTDARFRARNEAYIKSRFAGCDAFSILTRVPVQRGLTVTPDWTRPDARLHEWPRAAE
jgi:hypothetical protein